MQLFKNYSRKLPDILVNDIKDFHPDLYEEGTIYHPHSLYFVCYIFNPSMNEGAAFKSYGLDFVYDFDTVANCAEILSYKQNEYGNFALVATNKNVLNRFKDLIKKDDVNIPASLISIEDIHGLLECQAIVFVEEYGITRFNDFEKAMQQAKNVDKSIIGVVNLPL